VSSFEKAQVARAFIRFTSVLSLSVLLLRAETAKEFIYETAVFPQAHASTLVELSNGDLMAAWFGGTKEGAPDVAIWGAVRSNGRWSTPVELAREPEIATYNPVLFHTKDGRLWLYYKFGPHPTNWTGARLLDSRPAVGSVSCWSVPVGVLLDASLLRPAPSG
jgi:predicted neuraminidase